jgi:PiT family inorganic phosphate transporter
MPDLSPEVIILVLVVIMALSFDFINGFHDTANAIATSVSTRALSPRTAIIIASVFNLIGALTYTGVAKTIGGKITDPFKLENGLVVVLAALTAAILWNLITWWFGIPSSSSHAIIQIGCEYSLPSDEPNLPRTASSLRILAVVFPRG